MVALCACDGAVLPLACEAEVVGALAANVVVAEMVVEDLWVAEVEGAVDPLAPVCVPGASGGRGAVGRL